MNLAFPTSPDHDGDPSWRQEAIALVRSHIQFGQDGGVCRDSVWENLADTLQETGCLEWYPIVEAYFDLAWPTNHSRSV